MLALSESALQINYFTEVMTLCTFVFRIDHTIMIVRPGETVLLHHEKFVLWTVLWIK
jgi:hypothetical protein